MSANQFAETGYRVFPQFLSSQEAERLLGLIEDRQDAF